MVVYGNRQCTVGAETSGDINNITFEIPSDIVKVGNSIDILVRPKPGVCWKTTYDFATDKTVSKNLTAMTKVGTDNNTMKYKVAENVVTFVYQNTESVNIDNDSVVAVVYHRNFN